MRILIASIVAGFVLVAGANSVSAQGLYAGGQLGLSWGGGEFDNTGVDVEFAGGTFIDGFIGKDLGNQVRIEGELAYRQNDLDNIGGVPLIGDISSVALMGNAYYDFGDSSTSSFYLGVGMGIAAITLDSGGSDSDTTFALQLMLGGSFAVAQDLAMTIDLRSLGAVPTFVDGFGVPFEQGYGVGSLSLGLRKSF